MKTQINVVCAVIEHEGKILAVRRRKGEKMEGWWEFPGDKMKEKEEPRLSIVGEILEELELSIQPVHPLKKVIHEYPEFIIQLIPYRCYLLEGIIRLKVHDRFLWLLPSELKKVRWCEADQKLIEDVIKLFIIDR